MYNVNQSLDNFKNDRIYDFLNESNRIEGIKEIDYYDENYQHPEKGHFGAFYLSQFSAMNNMSNNGNLSIRDIKNWQKLIAEEQISVGHHLEQNEIGHIRGPNLNKNVRIGNHIPPSYHSVPTFLTCLIEDINSILPSLAKNNDVNEYCNHVSKFFLDFEKIHPFADGNGRVGRLLANYIATYCGRPLITFNSEMIEKNEYYRAHGSDKLMREFFWKKINPDQL